MPMVLKVIGGPDHGMTIPLLAEGIMYAGRGVDIHIALTDLTVSRKHFQLTGDRKHYYLQDLGSKTGTLVNNVPVKAVHRLSSGDIIVIGETHLQVLSGQGAPSRKDKDESTEIRPALGQFVMPSPGYVNPLARLMNTELGVFAIGPLLGTGVTGSVFRAIDTRDHSEVALKVFLPEFSTDEEEVQRFVRAIKTIVPLRHLNIVEVYGGGRADGLCWLSMELVEGPSVAWLVRQAAADQVDWRVGLRILQDCTRALIYLHKNQVLHRNLTPTNLLMNKASGLFKVGDLITAKAQGGTLARDITTEGEILGDFDYLSPERTVGGPLSGDARSDLYSLGAVVYAVMTGKPPIEGKTPREILDKIPHAIPIPPRKICPNMSPALDAVVMKLLAKNPEDRFPNATELLRHMVQQRIIS